MPANTKISIVKAAQASYQQANVHEALALLLQQLGLDPVNWGTPQWNPLKGFIRTGDRVLLKPNLIRQSHLLNSDWEYVITHRAILDAVLDYVCRALAGSGEIIIADGPQTDSDFDKIYQVLELAELKARYQQQWGCSIEVLDLREEHWRELDTVTVERIKLPGDPRGYIEFDLADKSEFTSHRSNGRYYGADYNFTETQNYHSQGRNCYRVARSPLAADVFINLPKLKTHKKTGVTLSLKNLVGIHGNRNYLPHHAMGTPNEGGDEFAYSDIKSGLQSQLTQWLKRRLAQQGSKGGTMLRALKKTGYQVFGSTEKVVRSGNWYGNDTAWRMVLDLNKILFYGQLDGSLANHSQRRYLTIVDGIIAGEGNGPMAPQPKPCGLLVGGFNPVAVDTVCATLMGFDYRKLNMLAHAWELTNYPLVDFTPDEIHCVANILGWTGSQT
ncbi:MAG: DUF362 domain-containing protein, partial [Acidobacteriota bacterium]